MCDGCPRCGSEFLGETYNGCKIYRCGTYEEEDGTVDVSLECTINLLKQENQMMEDRATEVIVKFVSSLHCCNHICVFGTKRGCNHHQCAEGIRKFLRGETTSDNK